jgi:hypothetical protein
VRSVWAEAELRRCTGQQQMVERRGVITYSMCESECMSVLSGNDSVRADDPLKAAVTTPSQIWVNRSPMTRRGLYPAQRDSNC